jgi:hypothetical protein
MKKMNLNVAMGIVNLRTFQMDDIPPELGTLYGVKMKVDPDN